jgi:hypothetical protein
MDEVAERLKTRTKRLACAVLDFVDTLPRTPSGDAIARQLARSGLGAIFSKACVTARSRERSRRQDVSSFLRPPFCNPAMLQFCNC